MTIADSIQHKLNETFEPQHLLLENESHMHAGPATDSHFKLTLVSASFDGQRAVQRHQAVYRALAEELAGPVHALALHLYSPQEWTAVMGEVPDSPLCANNK